MYKFCNLPTMKYLLCLIYSFCLAQTNPTLETTFLDKTSYNNKRLIFIDNFNFSYIQEHNTLYKLMDNYSLNYTNLQLGDIKSINLFNPLKINIFYKDFNSVIVLDNRLAEILKIDFNSNNIYKNVDFVSSGSDNTIWIFNQDSQQLELFDYIKNTTKLKTIPIKSKVLDLISNYNYCWLLTEHNLYKFNYFGSLVQKIKNDGFTSFTETNGNIILKKDNKLFLLKKESYNLIPIELPKLLITAFFVNHETLYIYDKNFLYKYQFKTN